MVRVSIRYAVLGFTLFLWSACGSQSSDQTSLTSTPESDFLGSPTDFSGTLVSNPGHGRITVFFNEELIEAQRKFNIVEQDQFSCGLSDFDPEIEILEVGFQVFSSQSAGGLNESFYSSDRIQGSHLIRVRAYEFDCRIRIKGNDGNEHELISERMELTYDDYLSSPFANELPPEVGGRKGTEEHAQKK